MTWLYRPSIRHPIPTIIVAALVTLAIAPGVLRLAIRTDGHALVPTDALPVQTDREVRRTYGIEDPIVLVIESDHSGGIYNVATLSIVRDLTRAFRELDRVGQVSSLATEKTDRVRPGTLKFRSMLEPFPQTQADVDRIRGDVRAIELYTGTFVSFDEHAAAIYVGIPDDADRTEVYRTVRRLIESQDAGADRIHVIGAPVAEALLGTHILEDLGVPDFVLGGASGVNDEPIDPGWPRDLHTVRKMVARYVGLVPIAMGIIVAVFWIRFRSLAAVVLPLTEVGACLMLVFGLMGWCGVPVYLTIAVLPVILVAMGIADEVHIFTRYVQVLRDRPDGSQADLVLETLDEMWRPVVKTSITTAVGFLSFALSPIAPVRMFGVFTAVGIVCCMLWSLTVIPALLVLMKPDRLAGRRGRLVSDGREPFFRRLGGIVLRFRYVIAFIAIGAAAVAPWGVRKVMIQDSWIDGFAPASTFRQATDLFNEGFFGTHMLLVSVETGDRRIVGSIDPRYLTHDEISLPIAAVDDPQTLIGDQFLLFPEEVPRPSANEDGPPRVTRHWTSIIDDVRLEERRLIVSFPRISSSPMWAARRWEGTPSRYEITPQRLKRPETLGVVGDFEVFLREQTDCAVGGALGPSAYLATANYMKMARREGSRSVPTDAQQVSNLWRNYGTIRGVDRLHQIVTSDYSRGLISIFLKNANFVDTKRLMERIRAYEREHLTPLGISLRFAGDVAVSQALIDAIVSTQVRSLLISLLGVVLVASLLGRSLWWGILCAGPCALAVLINFAVMGVLDIPLGVATSMFAAMTLGIGVDYAIHLLERLRMQRSGGATPRDALLDALVVTGPAIWIDALAVALGFGIMTLSQVPANARLGGLLLVSIMSCLAATLLLLPAVLGIGAWRVLRSPR